MKLIIGSLSHTILLIVNSVSIADDFITRPDNADILTMTTACKYCFVNTVFQCARTHTYTFTNSYINLHILCLAIFIFSAASLISINSIFEHKSALDMLYRLYPWAVTKDQPNEKQMIKMGITNNLLKIWCYILHLIIPYDKASCSLIVGYAFILKSFSYPYFYNINATPDGLVMTEIMQWS